LNRERLAIMNFHVTFRTGSGADFSTHGGFVDASLCFTSLLGGRFGRRPVGFGRLGRWPRLGWAGFALRRALSGVQGGLLTVRSGAAGWRARLRVGLSSLWLPGRSWL